MGPVHIYIYIYIYIYVHIYVEIEREREIPYRCISYELHVGLLSPQFVRFTDGAAGDGSYYYIRGIQVLCRSVSRKASEREDECTRPWINHPDNSG